MGQRLQTLFTAEFVVEADAEVKLDMEIYVRAIRSLIPALMTLEA